MGVSKFLVIEQAPGVILEVKDNVPDIIRAFFPLKNYKWAPLIYVYLNIKMAHIFANHFIRQGSFPPPHSPWPRNKQVCLKRYLNLESIAFTGKGQNQIIELWPFQRHAHMFWVLRYFHLKFHTPIGQLVLSSWIFFSILSNFCGCMC